MKTIIKYFFSVVVSIMILSGISLAQGMPATLVVTEKAETMEFHDQITLVGRTEAGINSRIVSEVSGRVVAIKASEGSTVERNDPLVIIDNSRIDLLLKAKEADATQRKAQAALSAGNLERGEKLYRQKLISESTIDSARIWAQITQSQYDLVEAERQKLALDFRNCTIRAPYKGHTGRQLVNIGDWVKEGTPVFETADLSSIKVIVDLPERHFGHLAVGSKVIIKASTGRNRMEGTVTGIAPIAIRETHTFPVIITVENLSGSLAGGMLVRATLSLNEKFTSLAVSKDAIVRQGMSTMLYTVVDGKASPIPVMTSSTSGDMIAVSGDGLTAGMDVVVRGNERIFPGSPVRTADSEPPPAEGAKN